MAAVTLADVPVEEIQARAAQLRFGQTLLAIVGWVLYNVGFLVAKLWGGLIWGSVKFVIASVATGWAAANGPSKRTIIEQQRRQIADMSMRLSRFDG